MNTSNAVNIERREKLLAEAMDLRDYCAEHRQTMHRCDCPFNVGGVCGLHFNYPDGWPDLKGVCR